MARTELARPYALAELLAAARLTSTHEAMRRLRLSGSRLRQLEAVGLTEDQADTFANRVELHPGDVWPGWWDVDDELLEAAAVASEAALAVAA